MRFWWVNHKQTFRHEFAGNYVWCPKRKKNNSINHFYETMREVRPGDLIFSYAFAAVQGFGFARTHCYSCPRPNEFGEVGEAWDRTGWRVDVGFTRLNSPFRMSDHMRSLTCYLPEKYSPIRENGHGNQGAYFSEIPRALAEAIAHLADPVLSGAILGNLLQQTSDSIETALPPIFEWEELEQRKIESGSSIEETTRTALICARKGQGLFKERISRFERKCRITEVDNPTHLIASHIKPWRESDNEERLHAGNGLMLTPTIDHLFDRGFISFGDDGELLVSRVADKTSLAKMGVSKENASSVGSFNTDQQHFLDYHRNEIFLQAAC
jgi:hypothetical protein